MSLNISVSNTKQTNYNNIIENDYDCAHLKIDGLFDGYILNFLSEDKCPGSK